MVPTGGLNWFPGKGSRIRDQRIKDQRNKKNPLLNFQSFTRGSIQRREDENHDGASLIQIARGRSPARDYSSCNVSEKIEKT